MLPALVGLVLGVATRVEELTPGFAIGLSSSTAWLGTALAVGSRAKSPAVAGATALTAANLGYYAVDGFTGPVAAWLMLGVLAGAAAGRLGAVSPLAWVPALTAVAASEALGLHVTVAGLHLP